MFSRPLILWLGSILALLTAAAEAQVNPLPYRPVASIYSSSLDEIVMISLNPNQLHIYNPVTKSDTAVNLPQSPISLAISPDGNSAMAGMNGQISYINLVSATIINTSSVGITVNNVILGATYAWLFGSASNYAGPVAIIAATGAVLSPSDLALSPITRGVLNQTGTVIYAVEEGSSPDNMQKIDVSNGTFGANTSWPYNGDYPDCGPLWLSPDGTRIYTGCATIVHASSDPAVDMYYLRTLPVTTGAILGLTESAAAARLAVIAGNTTATTADTQIELFTTDYFNPAGTLQLSPFVTNAGSFAAHGKGVFYNSASTNLYVVEEADSTSNLLNDFAVETISLANPPACQASFLTTTGSVAWTGSLGSTGIAAAAPCQYTAVSNASWIQIVSGGYGSGNGTLNWIARPNLGSSARTGTISLGSQT
ncbi:MAG: hypothetical protein ABSG41_23525, partial [Bryobacteraceae bacterium]